MWLLLAMMGALVGSSVLDLSTRGDRTGTQDETDTGNGPEAGDGSDEQPLRQGEDNGDILDHAGPGDAGDPELDADGMPFESGRDPWLDGWREDDYISDDNPRPDPRGQFIRMGNGGGYLRGGDGNDTLIGGSGDDWIEGGPGDDLILGGDGNDTLIGGPGQSTLIGGAGDDSLIGGGGAALILGGSGNNLLQGGADDDTLIGGSGNDTLIGGYGDDLLVAGAGDNELNGGWGDDTLVGAWLDADGRDLSGANTLNGGDGADVLILGQGDLAHGGEGADSFVLGDWLDGNDPARILDFTPGEDRIILAHAVTGPAPLIEIVHDVEAGVSQVRVNGATVAEVNDPDGALDAGDIELAPYQTQPGSGPALGAVLQAVQ